jgi:hypothetical protein
MDEKLGNLGAALLAIASLLLSVRTCVAQAQHVVEAEPQSGRLDCEHTRRSSEAFGRDAQEKALNQLDRNASQAHECGDVQSEIDIRQRLSNDAWAEYARHPRDTERWNRWAIVYENDLPLARLLEGSGRWSAAEVIYLHNQSSLKHERLAGNDIKSENDLHLAHLLIKEGKSSEASSICSHWKIKVKHNADFALSAVKYNVPTPPLYDTPEVEVAGWELACGRVEDGLAILKEQILTHPGMLAPFTRLAAYYTTEGDFKQALAIEKNGTSALLTTPTALRK